MKKIARRKFLEISALSTASFTILPRYVLGGKGYTAPSDKLNIAGIGVGGMGRRDISEVESENIVALCDVDWNYAAETFKKYPAAKKYKDFRVMLDKQKDIDAVVVATPDHTHAVASMAAINHGKHVYCEKPLSYTIYEARRLTEAARKAGVITQMGNQGHAMESLRLLCEWIWDGAIGPVYEVHAWTPHPVWPQGVDKPSESLPVPEDLDWDLWLGPAPQRDYHSCYHPTAWRGWWDFGTGGLGDMGCHIFDHINEAMKFGPPDSVEASSSIFVRESMNWEKVRNTETYPRASIVRYRFPARENMPPLKLTWYDGGLMPERPEELEPGRKMGDTFGGALYIGEKGKILTGSHGARGARIIPESKMRAYEKPPKTLPRSIGHREEWIEGCKTGKQTPCNFDYSGPLTETVLLGNIALRFEERIEWDARNMKITNLPRANKFLHREYRTGWTL